MRTLSHTTIALALFTLAGVLAPRLAAAEVVATAEAAPAPAGPWSALVDPLLRAAGQASAQDEDGQDGEGQEEGDDAPEPQLVAVSKVDRLARALLEAHGGVDALNAFTSLQFTVTPVQIVPVANPAAGEPAFEELRRAPIEFQAVFGAEERLMRMDEPMEVSGAQHVTTKILRIREQGNEVEFLLDGNARTVIAETRAQITQDVLTLVGQFDVLLGLGTGQLVGQFDGVSERDGVAYETVVAQFFGGQQPEKTYRLFLNPDTHLVDRYDLYDTQSRRLMNKQLISGYTTFAGLQLPSAITFQDRRGVPFMRWEFTAYQVNEEIDRARFLAGASEGEGEDGE